MIRLRLPWILVGLLAACTGDIAPGRGYPRVDTDGDGIPDTPSAPGLPGVPGAAGGSAAAGAAAFGGSGQPLPRAGELPPAMLRRLTLSQYENSVRDLLGVSPDTSTLSALPALNGLRAIGASTVSVPQRDVEAFETLADSASAKVFGDTALRMKLTGCDARQAACAEGFVASFGRRVFRRPLSDEERTRYLDLLRIATQMSGGDGWIGLRAVSQALFQSANFLYRSELGAPDPADPKRRVLSSYELAARLSFFLWNTTPDPELLDAAESGALAKPDGLAAQARRLLGSPRAAEALDELFSDYLHLDALDALVKLPETYPAATATLGPALKQETLLMLKAHLWTRGLDFREVFTTGKTFVNPELAKLYGVRAPSASDFAEIDLPASGPRAGLLMQGSFLALHSHPSRSSPTLRGKFMRENLLCQAIPPPPPNVDTTLTANTKDAMTARQRLTRHREDPSCAGCHVLMDPLGLALEKFDGIGAHRERENNLAIDASGELDAVTFSDARGLATTLANHPGTTACFTRTVLRYARGALENDSEESLIEALAGSFAAAGYKLPELMRLIVTDASFRHVGAIQ